MPTSTPNNSAESQEVATVEATAVRASRVSTQRVVLVICALLLAPSAWFRRSWLIKLTSSSTSVPWADQLLRKAVPLMELLLVIQPILQIVFFSILIATFVTVLVERDAVET